MNRCIVNLALCLGVSVAAAQCRASAYAAASTTDVAANDNTQPAGRLEHGTLRLDLVARNGRFYPDGPGTIGLPIEAFGEAGKPLQIPGPLVRVPVGTRVVASVRNELGHRLFVRGLARSGDAVGSVLRIEAGATRTTTFVLDRAGAYGYYASDHDVSLDNRIFADAELSGAIIVEKPGVPRIDHIFVLGLYDAIKDKTGAPNFLYLLETINGRSFPATEHLTYASGRHVRWAVFNASAEIHPMHLHGFYFRLDAPDAYDEVTHAFHPGDAAELSWTADRAGSWMYHCHITDHTSQHASLHTMLARRDDPPLAITPLSITKRFHQANRPMGGMVIDVTVLPRPGAHRPVAAANPRRLALSVEEHTAPGAPYPELFKAELTLRDGDQTTTSSGNLGPTIVLTRGEPVAIAVTNRMSEETSMHWHGIALDDSYYDGGAGMNAGMSAGMSMHAMRISPPIEPGGTFVARFAPPDAGTFMYHAHMDDGWQLGSGVDGPLIVLPPGQRFDQTTDHVIMVSESFEKAGYPPVAIDGFLKPPPITMKAGVAQRLRIIVLTLGGEHFVASLAGGTGVVRWTPIAKDGKDLPAGLQREQTATHAFTIGETRDFRFTPSAPGSLILSVYDDDNNGQLVASLPIVVSP